MIKCSACATEWTSSGLPLCPVCNTRVDEATAPSTSPVKDRRVEPTSVIQGAASDCSALQPTTGGPALGLLPEFRLSEAPEPRLSPLLEGVEPWIPRVPPPAEAPEPLPAPARATNGPLVLGFLALVPVLLLPLTLEFEAGPVLGILGFCLSGFFAPFAPIAWIAGLSVEKRRRDQGRRPEFRVSLGRLLGQTATLLLVAEMTVALVGIAALRLSGRFPSTFWAYF